MDADHEQPRIPAMTIVADDPFAVELVKLLGFLKGGMTTNAGSCFDRMKGMALNIGADHRTGNELMDLARLMQEWRAGQPKIPR